MENENIAANVKTFLQLCRDRYLGHENLNKELQTKAIGITTFGATLFGISISWADGSPIGKMGFAILLVMGLCVVAMSILSLLLIIRPQNWSHPFKLEKFQDLCNSLNHDSFGASLANTYKLAIYNNEEIIKKRSSHLARITKIAVGELALFVFFSANSLCLG